MSRADENTLSSLHGAVAELLLQKVRSGEASAAELSTAIKFLKDNGIDCVGKENPDIGSLADAMQFPVDVDDDENGVIPFRR